MNRIRIRPFPSLQNRHKGPNSEHPTSEMKTVVKHFHRSKFSLLENSPPPPQPGRQTARASSRLATAHLIIPVDAPTSRHGGMGGASPHTWPPDQVELLSSFADSNRRAPEERKLTVDGRKNAPRVP